MSKEFFAVSFVFILLVGGGLFGFFYFINKTFPYWRSRFKYKVLKKKYEQGYLNILGYCDNPDDENKLYQELLINGAKPRTAKDIVFISKEIQKQKNKEVKGGKKQEENGR